MSSDSSPEKVISLIDFKTFLESVPPGNAVRITDRFEIHHGNMGSTSLYMVLPTIQLHCSKESCDGIRFFAPDSDRLWVHKVQTPEDHFISYTCKNCSATDKTFAIRIQVNKPAPHDISKIGEIPPYGIPTPARVISLIGPDRDYFLKGRRCENQGLGIGAFAYYRRIVENHKDRIFDELIRVCEKVAAPKEVIDELNRAKQETQFTKAVESIKHSLPSVILIDGQHNPLTLLHSALSQGLHAHSDEECLKLAQNIRVVLTDLADRASQALKVVSELDSAVKMLMKGGGSKPVEPKRAESP